MEGHGTLASNSGSVVPKDFPSWVGFIPSLLLKVTWRDLDPDLANGSSPVHKGTCMNMLISVVCRGWELEITCVFME